MTVPSLLWHGPTGVGLPFTPDNGIQVLHAPIGMDATPIDLVEESTVNGDGAVFLARRYPPRTFVIPMLLEGTRVRDVTSLLVRSLQGPGELEFQDGTVFRKLRQVYYTGGLEGSVDGRHEWASTAVALRALDPLWYGGEEVINLTVGAAVAFDAAITFDNASTQFDGSDTTSFGAGLDGDAPAFPRFTIVGPFSTLTVGIPGGDGWVLAAALTAGNTITIDSRPGSRGPSLNGGDIDWSLITPTSRLFNLDPGLTGLVITSSGATGASSVTMRYEPRFLTL